MNNIASFYGVYVFVFVYALSFLKEYFFVSYVAQLKEYRRVKFVEYLFSKQGKRSFFGRKMLMRLCFLLAYLLFDLFFSSFGVEYILLGLQFLWLLFEGYNALVFVRSVFHRSFLPVFTQRYLLTLVVSIALFAVTIFLFFQLGLVIYGLLVSYFLIVPILFFSILLLRPLESFLTKKLVDRARGVMSESSTQVIAISGSYGKSSVKNFLTTILNKSGKTALRTNANVNTVKGIAGFIIRHLANVHDYFVCEMGGDTPGEISTIGTMLGHKIGILTGLNNQHAALYGGLRGAIKAETEIVEQLSRHKGVLYANMDNEYIQNCLFPSEVSVVGYSIVDESASAYSEISGKKLGVWSFVFHYKGKKYDFETDVLGEHNVLNLTGILACCIDLGISYSNLKDSLLDLRSHQKTLSEIPIGESLLLDDRYNINIDGVHAGVKMLAGYKNFEKKIVVINEINELGKETQQTHFDLGSLIARFSIDYVFLTGENYSHYIYDGLVANGFFRDQIVDCYSIGFASSYRQLNDLVVGGSSVVLFLGREQGVMKFFDDLSTSL